MSQNSQQYYNISNEQLLLINILNGMYNDNLRQINNLNDSLDNLNQSNRQIRGLLIQILNNPSTNSNNATTNYNNRRNNSSSRRGVRNNFWDATQTNLERIYLNNRPYIIDHIDHYNIPTNRSSNTNTQSNLSQILQNFFQPVEVFPTQSQIESATRRARYSDILNPRNRSCPISLETFADSDLVTIIRFCGHIFNTDQLNTWFRSNCRCPVCRYDIRRHTSGDVSTEFFSANTTANTNDSDSVPSVNSTPSVPSTPSTPSTPSLPLNQTENNSSILNEERNTLTSLGRNSNALLFFNNILDNINSNDINLNNIEYIGGGLGDIINDLSGNNTSDIFINLLNGFNNRGQR